MKTKFPVALWHKADEPDYGTYAFPLGEKSWDEVPLPMLDVHTWDFQGVLPKGMRVEDVRKDRGNRVRCKLNGAPVFTADWALED